MTLMKQASVLLATALASRVFPAGTEHASVDDWRAAVRLAVVQGGQDALASKQQQSTQSSMPA